MVVVVVVVYSMTVRAVKTIMNSIFFSHEYYNNAPVNALINSGTTHIMICYSKILWHILTSLVKINEFRYSCLYNFLCVHVFFLEAR